MKISIKDARFIQFSDVSYMYEIQSNGESVQQYKKAFFWVFLETETGEGLFVLHASYSKEGKWTRFMIEHTAIENQCCICSASSEDEEIYCFGATQEELRDVFTQAIEHPNVQEDWQKVELNV